ncbi:hypothetical protein SAMN04515617_13615 [Collimonas sp. OK242]|jgi:hypothetical protein|nr:hypothetical protein [Collimonas sp. OK242]SDY96133.1 hypothetical protein SAMN04515617_13615 [Collimonas sp. OK242]
MKKRFTEEQIIGFLKEADAGRTAGAVTDGAGTGHVHSVVV